MENEEFNKKQIELMEKMLEAFKVIAMCQVKMVHNDNQFLNEEMEENGE